MDDKTLSKREVLVKMTKTTWELFIDHRLTCFISTVFKKCAFFSASWHVWQNKCEDWWFISVQFACKPHFVEYYLDGVGSHVIHSTIPSERGLPSHAEKSLIQGFYCANAQHPSALTLMFCGVKSPMSIWLPLRRIESELIEVSLLIEMNADFLFYYSNYLFSCWLTLFSFYLFGMS